MRRLEEVAFWREYVETCRSRGHEPPKSLRGQVGRPTLEIARAEALTLNDWKPLLSTLAKDTSLHYLAVMASSTRYKVLEGLVFERDVRGSGRRNPALYSKYLMNSLANSLANSIAVSKNMTSLLLSKIPIKGQYLQTLCMGIGRTKSLQHLAFHHCPVEDEGCAVICKALSSRPSLTTLDLSDCALTHISAENIAELIKKQCCVRVSEVWKGSLRYRQPVGEDMPGLRRITLNLNPEMGDKGVKNIIIALQDDLWIKGIDMQRCNISEAGAYAIASLLEQNQCLTVFDIRGNPQAVHAMPVLMSRLKTNMAYAKPGSFKCRWMEEVEPPSARVSQMTLQHTAPSSKASVQSCASVHSITSCVSEPPWHSNMYNKAVPGKMRNNTGKVNRTKSLEIGANRLRFVNSNNQPDEERDFEEDEDIMNVENEEFVCDSEPEEVCNEEEINYNEENIETRKPLISVTQEQYDILSNFKKMTQSFVKAREEENFADDNSQVLLNEATEKPEVQMNYLSCGDSISKQLIVNEDSNHHKEQIKPMRLEAGDASSMDKKEDIFKERAHRLIKKLIKIRHDRGLESNDGVMKVCSRLSLPEAKSQSLPDTVHPSASYMTISNQQSL